MIFLLGGYMLFTIGSDFCKNPSGRYYTDGDGSGEEFREDFLVPILKYLEPRKEVLTINIDKNVSSYGSSFLVEAFGNIVKYGYFSSPYLKDNIHVIYEIPIFKIYSSKIEKYIFDADFDSEKYVSTKGLAISNKVYKGAIKKTFLIDNLN